MSKALEATGGLSRMLPATILVAARKDMLEDVHELS